jgi:hypothetical protein
MSLFQSRYHSNGSERTLRDNGAFVLKLLPPFMRITDIECLNLNYYRKTFRGWAIPLNIPYKIIEEDCIPALFSLSSGSLFSSVRNFERKKTFIMLTYV